MSKENNFGSSEAAKNGGSHKEEHYPPRRREGETDEEYEARAKRIEAERANYQIVDQETEDILDEWADEDLSEEDAEALMELTDEAHAGGKISEKEFQSRMERAEAAVESAEADKGYELAANPDFLVQPEEGESIDRSHRLDFDPKRWDEWFADKGDTEDVPKDERYADKMHAAIDYWNTAVNYNHREAYLRSGEMTDAVDEDELENFEEVVSLLTSSGMLQLKGEQPTTTEEVEPSQFGYNPPEELSDEERAKRQAAYEDLFAQSDAAEDGGDEGDENPDGAEGDGGESSDAEDTEDTGEGASENTDEGSSEETDEESGENSEDGSAENPDDAENTGESDAEKRRRAVVEAINDLLDGDMTEEKIDRLVQALNELRNGLGDELDDDGSGEAVDENPEGESDAERAERERNEMARRMAEDEGLRAFIEGKGLHPGDITGMNNEQLQALIDEYEGNHGEDSEEESDAERAERERNEMARRMAEDEGLRAFIEGKGLHPGDITGMSNEELRALIDEYDNRGEGENSEEESDAERLERERNEMLRRMAEDEGLRDFISSKGLHPGDIAGMNNEQLQALIDEYEHSRSAGGEQPTPTGQEGNHDAIVMVSSDVKADAESVAKQMAQEMMADRLAQGGGLGKAIRGLIWGQMFREGVIKHYEKKALELLKHEGGDENADFDAEYWKRFGDEGANKYLKQYWSKKAGTKSFQEAYLRGMEDEMIHSEAGEHMSVYGLEHNDDGSTRVVRYEGDNIVEIDQSSPEAHATVEMRSALERFATKNPDGTYQMTNEEFEEQMKRIQHDLSENGGDEHLRVDNYLEMALAVRERVDHEQSVENVMEGFRFINAEAHRNLRSEAYYTGVDRITDRLAQTPGLRWIPAEVVGAAASLAVFSATRAGTTVMRAAGGLVGGSIGAGIAAAVKERYRVTGDRATMARRLAAGDRVEGMKNKYDRSMADTFVDRRGNSLMISAHDETEALRAAAQSGDTDEMIQALAHVKALNRASDAGIEGHGRMDLITYSGSELETIEAERMDMARAQAELAVALRNAGIDPKNCDALDTAVDNITEQFGEDLTASDKAFKSLRRRRMLAQGAKTAAFSLAIGTAVQEVAAYGSEKSYGLIEHITNKAGLTDTTNVEGANRTLLAGLAGIKQENVYEAVTGFTSKEEAERFASSRGGGKVTEGESIEGDPVTESHGYGANEYASEHGRDVHRLGWYNNKTSAYDKNELHVFKDADGYYARPSGIATSSNGASLDFASTDNSELKYVLSLTRDTQSTPLVFDVTQRADGSLVPDLSNASQDVIKAIQDESFAFLEFAHVESVAADGSLNIMPIATDVGSNTIGKIVENITTIPDPIPTWDVSGFTDDVMGGVSALMLPVGVRRKNLSPRKPNPNRPTPTRQNPPRDNGSGNNGRRPNPPSTPTSTVASNPRRPNPPTNNGSNTPVPPAGGVGTISSIENTPTGRNLPEDMIDETDGSNEGTGTPENGAAAPVAHEVGAQAGERGGETAPAAVGAVEISRERYGLKPEDLTEELNQLINNYRNAEGGRDKAAARRALADKLAMIRSYLNYDLVNFSDDAGVMQNYSRALNTANLLTRNGRTNEMAIDFDEAVNQHAKELREELTQGESYEIGDLTDEQIEEINPGHSAFTKRLIETWNSRSPGVRVRELLGLREEPSADTMALRDLGLIKFMDEDEMFDEDPYKGDNYRPIQSNGRDLLIDVSPARLDEMLRYTEGFYADEDARKRFSYHGPEGGTFDREETQREIEAWNALDIKERRAYMIQGFGVDSDSSEEVRRIGDSLAQKGIIDSVMMSTGFIPWMNSHNEEGSRVDTTLFSRPVRLEDGSVIRNSADGNVEIVLSEEAEQQRVAREAAAAEEPADEEGLDMAA